jgi:hypothetical protein
LDSYYCCLISGTGGPQCQEYYWTSVSHLQSRPTYKDIAPGGELSNQLEKEIPRVAYVRSLELPWMM